MRRWNGDDEMVHIEESIEIGELTVEITLKQCEQAIAEDQQKINEQRDHITSLTREWNNLCNLRELYKPWPLAALREEAEKYGAEASTSKKQLIENIMGAYELNLASRIDASEHAIQGLSEEILEFQREVKRIKTQQVEIA